MVPICCRLAMMIMIAIMRYPFEAFVVSYSFVYH